MTRIQRRRLIRSVLRGTLLALVAVLVDAQGLLTRPEHALYDFRAAYFQSCRPPPTNKLFHLDIDETALTGIGAWPWPRDIVAQLLDEIRLAEPKVVALDILFGERSRAVMELQSDTAPDVDPDAPLANAIKRLGCVIVPMSVSFESTRDAGPLDGKLIDLLVHDPELTSEQCADRLSAAAPVSPTLREGIENAYLAIRPLAIAQRIDEELDKNPALDFNGVDRRLLPDIDPLLTGSVLRRLVREEYDRAMRVRSIARFSLPDSYGLPVLKAVEEIMPTLPLCQAAAQSAFVNYLPDHVEGAVRSVPLLIEDRGRLFPQMALAAACITLGVDVRSIRISPDEIVIPRSGHPDIRIPVSYRSDTRLGPVGMLMDVPMFGPKDNWLAMYDPSQRSRATLHVSIYRVYQAVVTHQRITSNESATDQVVLSVLDALNPTAAGDYRALARQGAERTIQIRQTLATLDAVIAGLAAASDLDEDDRQLLHNLRTNQAQLRELVKQTDALKAQLTQLREELHQDMGNRAVFLGGTATGNSDFHPTSLHYSCPGIVIHGAVFNAIMTGKLWRRASPWVDAFATLGTGLLVTALVTALSPTRALIASALVVGGYLLFNAYVLFDFGNYIVGGAGPAMAGLLVWGGLTLADFITEITERARITGRFRSYVDPALVDFVLSHPEQARFDGEVREMSMGFTDLAGFTALTERLAERSVPLLSEYMGEMIPVIRSHNGYVAKLMGDGIFFFFGAPETDPNHAANAVATVIDMRKALDALNARLIARDLPQLGMRAGVSTGRVVIGDAGPADASDYTAMGDSVNLASRLESANKVFGSHTLITGRTLALMGDEFLVRPIALLQVMGKTEGVQVFEPLARHAEATERQRTIAQFTAAVVKAYQESRFADALDQLKELETIVGKDKLIALYRRLSEGHILVPPHDFCGQVVLAEK